MTAQATRTAVLIVGACFLVRGFFYSAVLPLWEGYDEYAHFAFVQHLAAHGGLPLTGTKVADEIAESMLDVPLPWTLRQYLSEAYLTHDDYWKLSPGEREVRQQAGKRRELLIYEASQPPLYYWLMSWPLRVAQRASLPARVLLLRWLGVAVASLVIPLGFLTARRVLGADTPAIGVVAVVAAMPELLLDVGRVSNEVLAIPIFTLLLYLTLRGGPTWLLGVVLGLGLLTKAYFLAAVPALLVVFLWKRKVPAALLALATAPAICGWWYWRSLRLTGTWTGVTQAVAQREASFSDLIRQVPRVNWRNALDSTFVSHIWFGNWSFLQVRSWMYHVFAYIVLLAIVGLAVRAARKRFTSELGVLAVFYGFFLLGLGYNVLLIFATHGVSATTGWYIYCLVVAEVVLAAAGLWAIVPARFRPWIVPAGVVCFVLLELYATHFVLIPYYTGLITHRPDGSLVAFHLGQLRDGGLAAILLRLQENKPAFVGFAFMVAAWLTFLAATVSVVWVALRTGRSHGSVRVW